MRNTEIRKSGSKTYFKPRGIDGVVGDEFEVIEPDRHASHTVTSQSVGGGVQVSNAIGNSMRLPYQDDQQSDYYEELQDNLDDLPEGLSGDVSGEEGRLY